MAVMVLLIEKGTKLVTNKIVANNRQTKEMARRRRIYLMRQKGLTNSWIAWKLGLSEEAVKAALA